ncbi:MAG: YIP1 family protein [Exiguobacterium profundum]|nr:MAG: YIP1 family protein [Exiguobacterium profundum]
MASGLDEIVRFAVYTIRSPRGARASGHGPARLGRLDGAGAGLRAVGDAVPPVAWPVDHGRAGGTAGLLGNPLGTVVMSALALSILVFGSFLIGRAFGGRGQLDQAALLIAWLQAIFLMLQLVQVVFMMILPVVAELIGTFGLALFLWLLTPFVAELHGFQSVWKVLFGIIGSVFAIAFALSILIVLVAGI